MEDIVVRPIRVQEAPQARQLILTGLQEKWGDLDPSRNPDLDDIVASYSNGKFLVAVSGSKIIGTGALVPEAESTARIVRMWVAEPHRGRGVGTEILEQLLKPRLRGRAPSSFTGIAGSFWSVRLMKKCNFNWNSMSLTRNDVRSA